MTTAVTPIRIHPENAKYFLFREQPLVLVCATEHYGAVMNRRFDMLRYLDEAADKRQTLTRLFLLYRELQTPRNPHSPLKMESPDWVTPWTRTGPGKALDGEPRFDLDRWNEEYFGRLHRFLGLASERGIVVEAVLFSNAYTNEIWQLNPLHGANNVNDVGRGRHEEYTTPREAALVEGQEAYVRKVVRELNGYDNLYYEVCNEPGASGDVSPREVDAWQQAMAATVREVEAPLPHQHLVFGEAAWRWEPANARWLDMGTDVRIEADLDPAFDSPFDAVNVHPDVAATYRGRGYRMSRFMERQRRLGELRAFLLATCAEDKPCVVDEDNSASMYLDDSGWTVHRQRAWTTVLSGSHYDFIDFSIQVGLEAGTEASRQRIRTWMRNLSEFIHGFDFIHARPEATWLRVDVAHTVVSALAAPGWQYAAYIADARELGEEGAGTWLSGSVQLDLPAGLYLVSLYSPVAGQESPGITITGGEPVTLSLPPFAHDVVVVARRRAEAW